MTPQHTIAIHILSNISRSKDNQIMKFGQLIEYNIRKIFLKNDTQMWWRNYSQKIKFEHNSADELLLSLAKFISKNKQGFGTSLLPHFQLDFFKKNFVWFYSINWPRFIVFAFSSWDIGVCWYNMLIQYVCCNYLLTRLWHHKLWN